MLLPGTSGRTAIDMTFARSSLRIAALAAISLLALAGSALAQDRPGLFDNMFGRNDQQQQSERRVAPGDSSELAMRIERIESTLRQLTGTIEQLQHQNQMLQMQLQQLGARGANPMPPAGAPAVAAPVVAPPAPAAPGQRSDAFDPNKSPNAPGAPRLLNSETRGTVAPAAPGPIAADEPPIGPPNGRDAGAPLDLNSLANGPPPAAPVAAAPGAPVMQPGVPPVRNVNPSGTRLATLPPTARPQDEYDMAYGYVLHKDYALAEQAFRDFIKKHPEERLLPDAQYWLGESLFQQQRYRDAAESFLAVSTKYEQSGKAPDSLLRLGQSLAAMKQKEAACATLAEVGRKYPRASASVKRSVAAEQKRTHC
jgi:tol-pal system protein YbgF